MSPSNRPTPAEALASLRARLEPLLPERSREWWHRSLETVSGEGETALSVRFPALLRRCGAEPVAEPTDADRFLRSPDFAVDLAAYRRADAGAVLLVRAALEAGAPPRVLRALFDHGDSEERTSVMRCLPFLGDDAVVVELMGEAQRSNNQDVIEAAYCDHDAAARRLDDDDFNRLVLKLAFMNVPFWRVLGGLRRANPELSRMLQDFAREREAAGRPIWTDTLRLIARAPVAGTRGRILGAIEHGLDELRLAGAEGLAYLGDAALADYARERLPREHHAAVREQLEKTISRLESGA